MRSQGCRTSGGGGIGLGGNGPRECLDVQGVALSEREAIVHAADKHFRAVQDLLALRIAARARHHPGIRVIEHDDQRFFAFKIVTAIVGACVM